MWKGMAKRACRLTMGAGADLMTGGESTGGVYVTDKVASEEGRSGRPAGPWSLSRRSEVPKELRLKGLLF